MAYKGSHLSMKLTNICYLIYFYSRESRHPVRAYSWLQGNEKYLPRYLPTYTVGSKLRIMVEGSAPLPDEIDDSSLASKKCVVLVYSLGKF